MKSYELVAAIVARTQLVRQLSWAELGEVFDLTKDAVRNRINRFKEKYNIVDADVNHNWARKFLTEHTPEAEKGELAGARYVPGSVIPGADGEHSVILNPKGDYVRVDRNDKPIIIRNYSLGGIEVTEYEVEAPLDIAPSEVEVVVQQQIEPLKWLDTPAVIVVVRDGQPITLDKTHKNFDKIREALQASDWQSALDFIDMKNTITKYSNGRVTVEDGVVSLDGERVTGKIVTRLVTCLMEENIEQLEYLTNFLGNCDENPDYRVVTRIYDFIAHNDLRLDKDGYVLAYKVVKHDYKDKYTGTMDNSPGELVQMKRNKVNPKDTETCSFGLHVAAKSYIPSYGRPSLVAGGDRVVLCRVHPKDFVSIPTDYDSMKARVCEYLVLKDVTELFVKHELDEGERA